MSARGVAGDVEFRRIASVSSNISIGPGDSGACLLYDVRHCHLGAEIIFHDDHGRSTLREGWHEIAVVVFASAAPVATVDINKNRTRRLIGGVYVQHLPGRAAVRQVEPGFMRPSDFSAFFGS